MVHHYSISPASVPFWACKGMYYSSYGNCAFAPCGLSKTQDGVVIIAVPHIPSRKLMGFVAVASGVIIGDGPAFVVLGAGLDTLLQIQPADFPVDVLDDYCCAVSNWC